MTLPVTRLVCTEGSKTPNIARIPGELSCLIAPISPLPAVGRNERICARFVHEENFEFSKNSKFSFESNKQTRKPVGLSGHKKAEFQMRETPL